MTVTESAAEPLGEPCNTDHQVAMFLRVFLGVNESLVINALN